MAALLVGAVGVTIAPSLAPTASETLALAIRGAAVLAGVVASVRSRGRMRFSWIMLTTMALAWAAGDVLWMVYADADGSVPILSLADALYLGALLPAVVGLLVYPVIRSRSGVMRPVLLDALVLALALGLLSTAIALGNSVARSGSATEAAMLAVYPLTDAVLISLVAVTLLRSSGSSRLDVLLLGSVFATYLVADTGYAAMTVAGVDTTDTWVHVLYELAFLPLIGAGVAAALVPTPRRQPRATLTGFVAPLLPDVTALLALAVTLALAWDEPVSRTLSIGLLVAVGLRQLSQTVAGQDLRFRLEDRLAERSRELAEISEHYERLETMKYEFVTSVSHELRTPLTAIRGSLELLHDGDVGALSPAARNVVDVATRGSERLSRLVNDIIDLEKLETGAFGLSPTATDIRSLVDEAVASLSPLAREHRVRFVVTHGNALATCDPDRVVQVLVNLMGNALKYAPDDSEVVIGLSVRQGEVEVSVTDSGRGIPADQLEVVFGRFHQVSPDADTRQGGTGLGLAICKRIVEAHGGRIWVESSRGAGSTFLFTLPGASMTGGTEAPVPMSA